MHSTEEKNAGQPENMESNLDRIFLEQDVLLPSSGFAASVMNAIEQQAAAPAPIPFPWKWAVPGIVALLAGIVMVCRLAVHTFQSLGQGWADGTDWLTWLRSSAQAAVLLRTEVGPVLLALAASFACAAICRKLAGGWSTR